MTNAELNLAIAKLAFPDRNWFNDNGMIIHASRGVIIRFDYENWNDLMPLVVEHKISLSPEYYDDKGVTDLWDAESFTRPYVLTTDKNPQRALAECLLKVLETKDD